MQSPRHTRLLYVAPTAPGYGTSSIALGLVRALQAAGVRAGYVKPIADPGVARDAEDRSVVFARRLFTLEVPRALSMDTAESMARAGEIGTLLEDVVALVQGVAATADVVVVGGATLANDHPLVADLNLAVAKALRADVVPVVPGKDEDAVSLAARIADVAHRYDREDVELLGVVVSRARAELGAGFKAAAPLLGIVPDEPLMAAPRVADVVEELGFEVVEAGDLAGARVQNFVVAARSPEHLVVRLGPGTLVVTPGDRADVVLTTSFAKATGMPVAGVLLTCGEQLAPELKAFLEPRRTGLNILRTELQTFDAVSRLANLDRRVRVDDLERMDRLVENAADHLDVSALVANAGAPRSATMTPPMFRHALIHSARAAQKRIVLPEGDEPRTLAAAAICARKGIARCVLLGAPDAVRAAATLHGIELPDTVEILDPDVERKRYIGPMVELRKSKGMTPGQAKLQLEDTVVLGTMMLATGDVDGLVSGAVHTTASTVRPALQLIKTAPGSSIVSSVFFMLMPDQVLVYGDCAINPDPSAEELAEIAMQSADSAAAFGIEPRVAMISYSTGSSGTGADVDKVREATRIVKERRPLLAIDGPMQYDAASVESVGRQKAPDSPVAGRANVFVFPDLNTGNTTYKAVQRSAGVVSVGPMLQGLRKPVNDLSRGALVDDIVYTIALTAIQAATA